MVSTKRKFFKAKCLGLAKPTKYFSSGKKKCFSPWTGSCHIRIGI